MKKNLLWSLLAATAMMTACSEDTLTDNQPALTGAETPVAFSVNLGNAVTTYATDDAEGGWTNFKKHQLSDYQARVTIQVFAGDNAAEPYAQVRQLVPYAEGMGNTVTVENLRLAAGNSYTAVTWVDFVPATVTESTTEKPNDCYWNTVNLTKVAETTFADDIAPVAASPEARDAYTGLIKFTVNPDGTYDTGDATITRAANTAAINIDAKRKFAKVSLILTDYDNKTDWANAFANAGTGRVLDYLAMGVQGLSTGYNALAQAPIAATGTKYFHRAFTGVADDGVNDVNWIQEDGKYYPIFDFNYMIPAEADRNSADATYNMEFKGYNHGTAGAFTSELAAASTISVDATENAWKMVAFRAGSAIPVRTNCHTVIKLNMYKAYKCTVTIYDKFDRSEENVIITDDNTKASNDTHYINQNGPVDESRKSEPNVAKVVVLRGNDGVATAITITGVTAANFDAVMADIDEMQKLGSATVVMTASTIPAVADFTEVPAENPISLKVTAQTEATELSGMTSDLTLDMTNTAATTVTSPKNVTITGTDCDGAVTVTAANATITGGAYDDAVTVTATANATLSNGTYNGAVTVDAANATLSGGTYAEGATINKATTTGNATISGGSYAKVVTGYSNTTISGGSSTASENSNRAFFMANTEKKTVKVANSVFGVLYAQQIGDSEATYHILDFQNNNALYNSYQNGGKLGDNWKKINIENIN